MSNTREQCTEDKQYAMRSGFGRVPRLCDKKQIGAFEISYGLIKGK
jgi:hypothetical protein